MESSEELFQTAVSSRDSGDLDSALKTILQLLSQTPDSPRARLLLANIYYLLGCVELSAEEVSRLHERFPDRESLHRLLKRLDPSFDEVSASSETVGEADEVTSAPKPETEDTDPSERETERNAGEKTELAPPPQSVTAPEKASPKPASEEVIAETDFEFDDIDLLEDE